MAKTTIAELEKEADAKINRAYYDYLIALENTGASEESKLEAAMLPCIKVPYIRNQITDGEVNQEVVSGLIMLEIVVKQFTKGIELSKFVKTMKKDLKYK